MQSRENLAILEESAYRSPGRRMQLSVPDIIALLHRYAGTEEYSRYRARLPILESQIRFHAPSAFQLGL